MSIDDLIRDLVVEDQFKAKYTKRQRHVFCDNMYKKVETFIEEHEKETLDKLVMHQQANELMKQEMLHYHMLFIVYRALAWVIMICLYIKTLCPKNKQIVAKQ